MARSRSVVMKEIKACQDKLISAKKHRNSEATKYLRAHIIELQQEAEKSEP